MATCVGTIPPHEIYACGSCHHQPPVSHLFPACDKTSHVKNYPTLKLMIPAVATITYVQYGSFCVKNSFPVRTFTVVHVHDA